MIKIGITGGIGSGKTLVGNLFNFFGVPVFNADLEAKKILDSNSGVRTKLISIFGQSVYLPNHTIDRKKLATLIFNNEYLLKQVNEIIHPEVHQAFDKWSESQRSIFVLYEAAILFESGHYRHMNKNILVVADEEIRMKRVMRRDSATLEQVQERMANQWKDEQKIGLSDYLIYNNERELIIPQVLDILKMIKTDG